MCLSSAHKSNPLATYVQYYAIATDNMPQFNFIIFMTTDISIVYIIIILFA